MSTNKHTPGPWEVNANGNVESAAVHNVAIVYQATTKESWPGSDFATAGHCDANARLIAAAPEVLEALQEIVTDYREWFGPTHASTMAVVAMAQRAIAKATGSET